MGTAFFVPSRMNYVNFCIFALNILPALDGKQYISYTAAEERRVHMYFNTVLRNLTEDEWKGILNHPDIPPPTAKLLTVLKRKGTVKHTAVEVFYMVTRANEFLKVTKQPFRIRKTVHADRMRKECGRFRLVPVALDPEIKTPAS